MAERVRGFIKFFLEQEGYGFIAHNEGQRDIFFHASEVTNPDLLTKFAICEYTPGENNRGHAAFNVEIFREQRF